MIHQAEARALVSRWAYPRLRVVGWTAEGKPLYQIVGAATGVAFSNFLELKVLDHCFRNTAYTAPATVYAALYTVTPDDTGGGTEVTGGSYARKSITNSAAAAGAITNSATIDFGTATADWGTVVAVGVFDASTAGNLMAYGALLANKTVSNGDGFSFAATKLTIALD